MIDRDPELAALLLEELERHLALLVAAPADFDVARRSVHAIKGSAGLAGERELAASLERTERKLREGDRAAIDEAITAVRNAVAALKAGEKAATSEWPRPPAWLGASRIDASIRPQYLAEAADRIGAIDEAMTQESDVLEAARIVYRQVHTLKGAASAVGDEPMAWFCHGLEDLLRGVTTEDDADAALREVAAMRGVLASLVDDPERAIAALRAGPSGRAELNERAGLSGRAGSVPPPPLAPEAGARGSEPPVSMSTAPSARPSMGPIEASPTFAPEPRVGTTDVPGSEEPPRSRLDVPTVRVAADAIDRLIERWETIGLVREALGARADGARVQSDRLRRARTSLVEAQRLIGPPRPWGAPAAALRRIENVVNLLAAVAEEVDETSAVLRQREQLLREALDDAKRSLSSMRLTTAGRLFGRLSRTLEAEATRQGRIVAVQVHGAQEPLDRRLAEALLDPCMQLVRNAVAHGIESPEVRARAGKLPTGTVTLSARRAHGRIVLMVEDDGAGVDPEAVRRRAIEAGLVPAETAKALDLPGVLSLLVLPGLSTAAQSDLLAGRGMGLDVVHNAVRRIGGSLRISSRRHRGFTARIDVPAETGLTRVLWVEAGGETYAVPAVPTRGVRLGKDEDDARVAHLASCLDGRPRGRPPLVLELDVRDENDVAQSLLVGVDAVGRTEDLLVRPLSPLLASVGPFTGAVVRGDGSLHLALDVEALAPRVRALYSAP